MTVGTKTSPKWKYGQNVGIKSVAFFRLNSNLRCKWAGLEILAFEKFSSNICFMEYYRFTIHHSSEDESFFPKTKQNVFLSCRRRATSRLKTATARPSFNHPPWRRSRARGPLEAPLDMILRGLRRASGALWRRVSVYL